MSESQPILNQNATLLSFSCLKLYCKLVTGFSPGIWAAKIAHQVLW